jgi:hypothetical protein
MMSNADVWHSEMGKCAMPRQPANDHRVGIQTDKTASRSGARPHEPGPPPAQTQIDEPGDEAVQAFWAVLLRMLKAAVAGVGGVIVGVPVGTLFGGVIGQLLRGDLGMLLCGIAGGVVGGFVGAVLFMVLAWNDPY